MNNKTALLLALTVAVVIFVIPQAQSVFASDALDELGDMLGFDGSSSSGSSDSSSSSSTDSDPSTSDSDIIVLSHRYDDGRFSSEVKGEVLNNDTKDYDKFDINIDADFYDRAGVLLTSEQGFIDSETLKEGDRSGFKVFIYGGDALNDALTYDLKVNDERVIQGAYLDDDDAPVSDSEDEEDEEEDEE